MLPMGSSDATEKVLSEAARLIHRKGLSATTISDLQEATGLERGSLYFHFPSKHALGLRVLERAREQFREMLGSTVGPQKPMGGLPDMFDALLELNRRNEFVGGCIFGNTALEASDCEESYAEFVEGVFDEWQETLEKALSAAQRCGEVRSDRDAPELATRIIATLEGAIMLSRLKKQAGPFRVCIEGLRALLAPPHGPDTSD